MTAKEVTHNTPRQITHNNVKDLLSPVPLYYTDTDTDIQQHLNVTSQEVVMVRVLNAIPFAFSYKVK